MFVKVRDCLEPMFARSGAWALTGALKPGSGHLDDLRAALNLLGT